MPNPMSFLMPMDEGGWWMPGQPSINTTNRPELVLSPTQLDSMSKGSRNHTCDATA